MLIGRPIYLHFLDRELGKACVKPLTPDNALRALNSAVYATNSALYVGYSLLWESPALTASMRHYVQELSSFGIITTLSSYSTVDEFLDSRRSMYIHVPNDYPMYYTSIDSPIILASPTVRKDTHTTSALSRFFKDTDNLMTVSHIVAVKAETLLQLIRPISLLLKNREGKAITFHLFSASNSNNEMFKKHEIEIRRLVSYSYIEYYLSLYPNSTFLFG